MKNKLLLLFLSLLTVVWAAQPGGNTGVAVNPSGAFSFLRVNALGSLMLSGASSSVGGSPGGNIGVAVDPDGHVAFLHVDADGNLITTGGNPGTVTSVAMSVPAFLSIAGSPITSSGTLAVTLSGLALPVANGGTGLTSYTIGDLIYASASGTLSKLADVATGSVLVSGGIGVAPAWSATPTVTSVNKVAITAPATSATLTIANGKTLTASDNITLASDGTGTRTLNIGAGGTLGTGAFQSQTVLTGTANQISVSNSGVGATTISIPTNPTLPGNVTITGDVSIGTASLSITGTTGAQGITVTGTNQNFAITTSGTGAILVAGAASGTGRLIFPVATTNAGGIFFGTDTPLFRSSAGSITTQVLADAGASLWRAVGGGSGQHVYVGGVNCGNGTVDLGSTSATSVRLISNGTTFLSADTSQNVTFTALIKIVGGTNAALTSTTTWTSGAGAQAGTLLNAPVAGNPTSWIKVNDNGTTRYVPAW